MNTVTVPQNILSDDELSLFLSLQTELKSLKTALTDAEQDLQALETDLIARIDNGASIATNRFAVTIREIERRFPSWKEHYIELAGKYAADQVLNGTEAKLYRNLVVKAA